MSVPVYLYTGSEFGEKNEAINKIKNEIKKKYGEFDDYLYYASETPVATVVSLLQSDSLFVNATCIVYKASELINKKEDIETLVSWINSVTPTAKKKEVKESNTLILVSDENSISTQISKHIPKENQKTFWVMFENRRVPWLKDFFKKNNYFLTDDGAELILEYIENNTESLKNECNRFFIIYPAGSTITEKEVDDVLSDVKTENIFTLFASIVNEKESTENRLENTLSILQKIRLSKDSTVKSILAGLTYSFRKLLTYHDLAKQGLASNDFELKKIGISGNIKNQYINASRLYGINQTMSILSMISKIDMDVIQTGKAFEDHYLQMLLYAIIVKKGAFTSEYSEFEM